MLDLRSMHEDDFSVQITPTEPRNALQVTINKEGCVSLNSKLTSAFAKKPVRIQFTSDFTAMQIACTSEDDSYIFPRTDASLFLRLPKFLRPGTRPCQLSIEAHCWNAIQNGEGNDSQTLRQSNRKLPAPAKRNRCSTADFR